MGQELAKECACCAPNEDLSLEHRPTVPQRGAAEKTPFANVPQSEQKVANHGAPAYGFNSVWGDPQEADEGFFVPPPVPDAPVVTSSATKSSAAKSSQSSSSAASKPAATPKATSAPKASASVPSAPAAKPAAKKGDGVSFEAVLADLEGAEQAAYMAAFSSLSSGAGSVGPDHDGLRSFVIIHSGISEQDLDTELLKIASANDAFQIDGNGFVNLLQMHPISESSVLNLFLINSSDGETMTSSDCRTCLLTLMTSPEYGLNSNIDGVRAERIFDAVMVSASLSVSMEQWIMFAKTAARIVRLVHYANI
jgi:hypothetical protein